MQSIADHLNISKALVSRALSNKPGVNEETREKIRLTAIKLGYQINSSIMTIPTSKTGMIALLIPREDIGKELQYWGRIIRKIEKELNKKSLSLVLAGIDSSIPVGKGTPSCITDRKVDGAFVLGRLSPSYVLEVSATSIPIVLVDYANHYQIKADHVLADNFEGGYNATRHLIDCGHREIGFVGDKNYAFSFNERYRGFTEAIKDFKLETRNEEIQSFDLTGKCEDDKLPLCMSQLDSVLSSDNRPSALVCANDENAFFVYEMLSRFGLICPDDISVIGFDNLEKCEWMKPGLTTIDTCKETIGKRAVDLLVRRMEEPELRAEYVFISTEIIERESIKKI